jgi:uncharacterized protein YprB with RNaseH-like and TPR domain
MALSDSRKRKLQMLVRSLSQGDVAAASDVLRSCGPRRGAAGARPTPVRLERACPGRETRARSPLGELAYWHLSRRLEEVSPGDLTPARDYAAVMRGARERLDELTASAELCLASVSRPEDLLFMDIECCGLGSTPVFLIGTMHFADGQLVFDQRFARTYAEEPAVLAAFAERLDGAGLLVTFNGKAFDMNQIAERSVFHGLSVAKDARPHLDLLHESRRFWREQVPNCRLQTLEHLLCGRRRVGDIPGWAIPDAYHRFVETGDARQVRDILHHNLLDLLTMAQLLCAMLTGSGPDAETGPET